MAKEKRGSDRRVTIAPQYAWVADTLSRMPSRMRALFVGQALAYALRHTQLPYFYQDYLDVPCGNTPPSVSSSPVRRADRGGEGKETARLPSDEAQSPAAPNFDFLGGLVAE